ncbi:MAG: hypothetical protein HYS12_18835 [Planctomycetes bacterium]|nr:hypothetical protein [Planctomycetota bacterium]
MFPAMILLASLLPEADPSALPRFTEEREAAARFFVKKHVPELLPLLDELKKNNATKYQQEIREIFQVTEMLADLQDDEKRHDLELKIWKSENKAFVLIARLATPDEEERKKVQGQLRDLARELVDLDIQVLELKAEQLDKELGEVKDGLTRAREQVEQNVKTRYEGLLDKAKKPKK